MTSWSGSEPHLLRETPSALSTFQASTHLSPQPEATHLSCESIQNVSSGYSLAVNALYAGMTRMPRKRSAAVVASESSVFALLELEASHNNIKTRQLSNDMLATHHEFTSGYAVFVHRTMASHQVLPVNPSASHGSED